VNGVHDMGGMTGLGSLPLEADEPVFHAEWERRAFALTIAMGAPGGWSIDEARYARERTPAAEYLASSYYEIWLSGLERLLLERGLVTDEEMSCGVMQTPPGGSGRILSVERVDRALASGGPTSRPAVTSPVYAPGARVRARNIHPSGHTRLPRYVRGRVGRIVMHHGSHISPDVRAACGEERSEHLYTVAFAGEEIWGESAEAGVVVSVDAFESYLEAAP